MNITPRQREILFAIVEEHAETAAPVGSVTLAKLFGVSSATIRAEMAQLEEAGLIRQPHTSAGRVPTDVGYRMYVNSLVENGGDLAQADSDAEVEKMERGAGRERRTNRLTEELDRGRHVMEVRVAAQTRADYAIRQAVDALVELTGDLGMATIGDQLYLAGISRLLMQPEFQKMERVQAMAKLLDNLEPWLKEAAPGEALNIFIGQENPIGKTSEVSLIISKFRSPFSNNSYIGVLGPTRQNYSRVMPLVASAGRMLERTLL